MDVGRVGERKDNGKKTIYCTSVVPSRFYSHRQIWQSKEKSGSTFYCITSANKSHEKAAIGIKECGMTDGGGGRDLLTNLFILGFVVVVRAWVVKSGKFVAEFDGPVLFHCGPDRGLRPEVRDASAVGLPFHAQGKAEDAEVNGREGSVVASLLREFCH